MSKEKIKKTYLYEVRVNDVNGNIIRLEQAITEAENFSYLFDVIANKYIGTFHSLEFIKRLR